MVLRPSPARNWSAQLKNCLAMQRWCNYIKKWPARILYGLDEQLAARLFLHRRAVADSTANLKICQRNKNLTGRKNPPSHCGQHFAVAREREARASATNRAKVK